MKTLIAALIFAAAACTAQNFSPPATEVYELNAEELRSIGVVLQVNRAYFIERINSKNASLKKTLISPQMIQFSGIGRHKKEIPSKFIPVFSVTEYSGGSTAYFRSLPHFMNATKNKVEYASEAVRFYNEPNNLLAIRFKLDDGEKPPANVTLWYIPTPEFLNALPARYRPKSDNNTVTNVQITTSERINFGIKGLAPNPAAGGQTSAKIAAHNNITLTIALFDISGRKLLDFGNFEFSQGEREILLNLGDLPPGMYVVGVNSAEGTAEFERLMVTN
ncbi:MAG: T9SS type A sorting domain-containing protein [Bacteroidetes bacterium]|nr:T9SS type A sorting domain-containing protein [Bacteroidota bacterium]MCZ2133696.1 T9SS type A sorting domain-containing protein [Bacteroidota bacterium]